MNLQKKLKKKQRGMSLLEVLISILIIAISLSLSLIMLQTAIRYNESAANKNVALFEIQSIIGKMRANSSAEASYIVDSKMSKHAEQAGFNIDCFNRQCTSDEIAARDVAEWIGNIKSSLPDGQGKIQQLSPFVYSATISWTQINANAKDTEHSDNLAKSDTFDQEITVNFSI